MFSRIALILSLISLIVFPSALPAGDFPVYPVPQQLELTGGTLDLSQAGIAISHGPYVELSALAHYLSQEIASRCQVSLTCQASGDTGSKKTRILLGLLSDPDLQQYLAASGLARDIQWEVPEAYRLIVTPDLAVIAGEDLSGLFYGVQSFIQLIDSPQPGQALVKGARISDRPFKPLRGVHVYLPSHENIPFFKNFIRTIAHFKINTLILEVGGGMRLDRHPEINLAWENFCRAFYDMGDPSLKYGEQVPLGPKGRFQASVHTELAGGSWLSKEEVRDIVEFARQNHLNVVPEIQSLTHAYYLVLAHRDIAEIPEADWPDSYDAANPKSYELLFDVIDEYLEVIRPRWVHIGHDEWRAGIKGDTGKLYGEDVLKISRYLNSRGVGTMLWADHLIRGHNMERKVPEPPEKGVWYAYPSTEGAAELIAAENKDILMLNWSWSFVPTSDEQLKSHGWRQMFGNFSGATQYENWPQRLSPKEVLGAEMSTWCMSDELSYGQNGSLLNMLLSENLLWSEHTPPLDELHEYLAAKMPGIRERLSGEKLPSLEVLRKRPGYTFVPLNIAPKGNTGRKTGGKADLSPVPSGKIDYRGWPFVIGQGDKAFLTVRNAGEPAGEIAVGANAASLIFLQVCTGLGERESTYGSNYPEDTAELLGYYRVKYEDGFEETVPIRYGRNILGYGGGFGSQLYFAHTVELGADKAGKAVLAYAYEWVNPRPNRAIKSVDLAGLTIKSSSSPVLLALTAVKPPFTK